MRILTKNASVTEDFDLISKHRDRVLVGLSLTGTPDKDDVLAVVEPYASPVSERMAALRKARKMGLRTYGMLCPLLPGIADDPAQIDQLVRFAKDCGAEEVFCEAINARGNSLTLTEQVLREAGFWPRLTNLGNPQTDGLVAVRGGPCPEHPAIHADAHDHGKAAVLAVPQGTGGQGSPGNQKARCGRRLAAVGRRRPDPLHFVTSQ